MAPVTGFTSNRWKSWPFAQHQRGLLGGTEATSRCDNVGTLRPEYEFADGW